MNIKRLFFESVIWGICLWVLFALLSYLSWFYGNVSLGDLQSHISLSFFSIVVTVPFFETILFQYVPYTLFVNRKPGKMLQYAYLVVSAVLFGLTHWYHIYFVIITVIAGYFLALRFYRVAAKANEFWAILSVFFIHAIVNFSTTFIKWWDAHF